ncbi:hypothetical protein pipiens_006208 [Culex pipiens pipiens]|uniref:Tantalus-like domain-containing protein n=1 Tax=Culex pipiens pipiens TaxID=38569 RepID=A0ABD1DQX1_CULPP
MDSRQSPLRRAVTQRRSIRSAKRLARSTSGISPLAMSLLKSQHEQKKAALLRERAYRRELFNPLTHVSYADDDIDVDRPEEELEDLATLDSSLTPLCSNTDDSVSEEKKTTKSGKRFRAVRRRVSKVVARVFLRKSSKKAEEAEQNISTTTTMENATSFERSSPLRKPIRPRRRPSRVTTSTPIAADQPPQLMCDLLLLKSFHCTRMPSLTSLDQMEEDQRFFQCDRSLLLASCHYDATRVSSTAAAGRKSSSTKRVGNMRRHVTKVVAKALHLKPRRLSYMRLN